MDDEVISSVIDITGCTPEIARQYVQLGEGDVSQAVQLFFENGGADLSTGTTAPPPAPAARPADASNPINISDDDLPTGPGANVEDDEAMARRLQEEMYGGSGSNQEQPIRAPIARQAETLVGPDSMMDDYVDDAMQARLQAMQRQPRRKSFRICASNRIVLTSLQNHGEYSTNTGPQTSGTKKEEEIQTFQQPQVADQKSPLGRTCSPDYFSLPGT